MRLVGALPLADFAERYPDAKQDLEAWRLEVLAAKWSNPHELKKRYPRASLVGKRDVVFNIRHNRYRLHATVDYQSGLGLARRIGTKPNTTAGRSNMAMTHGKPKHSARAGIRVIRSRADYDEMRDELDRLLDLDPARGTPDRDRLDVLLVLLSDYEARTVAPPKVDPVEAILFRIDQLGLKPRDLEPYLGGRSRVSEILARKRPLSIAMIRALHEGLGIPAEALINAAAPPDDDPDASAIQWERFPLNEMIARGWIESRRAKTWTRERARTVLEPFFGQAGGQLAAAPLYRRSTHVRGGKDMDDFALAAWTARVRQIAGGQKLRHRYDGRSFRAEAIKGLVQLSRLDDGPKLAQQWLADRGVIMVVEAHLPRTRLDGAAMRTHEGTPIVALTIRYDRLDNFWFTLLHECAHVLRHLTSKAEADATEYFDDLDVEGAADPREREADDFARESLVPSAQWRASAVAFAPSVDAAVALADEVGVSPAVVAGRVRHEKRNFRLLSPLVGAGQVRRLFPGVRFD